MAETTSPARLILETMSEKHREEMRQEVIYRSNRWLGEEYGLRKDMEVNSDDLPPFVRSFIEDYLPQNPEAVVSLAVMAAMAGIKDAVVMLDRPLAGRVQEEVTEIVRQTAEKQGVEADKWLRAEDFDHGPEGISLFILSRTVLDAYVTELEKSGWETSRKKDEKKALGFTMDKRLLLEQIEELKQQLKKAGDDKEKAVEGAENRADAAEVRMKLIEAAVEDLPLLERMAVGLKLNEEFSIEMTAGQLREFLAERGVGCNIRLENDKLAIAITVGKETKSGFQGVATKFDLASTEGKLVRAYGPIFNDNVPWLKKLFRQDIDIKKIEMQFTSMLIDPQQALNKFLQTELQKRGVALGEVAVNISQGKLSLTVKRK